MLDEVLVDFSMPWNRLFHAVLRVYINVVSRTMSQQIAPFAFDLPNEVFSLHSRISLIS